MISAFRAFTQAFLVEISPIGVRVVHGDLRSSLNSLADEHDSLQTEPDEAFKLAVGGARMIHKSCVISLLSLPDLIRGSISLAYHDILVFDARRDLADKLADRGTTLEGAACKKSIVLAVGRAIHLYWHGSRLCTAIEVGEACAAILPWIIRLPFIAYLALESC